MNAELEKRLFKLLRKHPKDIGLCIDQLLTDPNVVNLEENRASLLRFIWNAGHQKSAMDMLIDLLNSKRLLPWSVLGQVLQLTGVDLGPEEQDAVWRGVAEQNGGHEILNVAGLEKKIEGFSDRRTQMLSQRLTQLAERKAQLRQNLDFLRTNRMYEQEAKVLDEIQLLFPNEPEFASERAELEVRLAKDILQSSNVRDQDAVQEMARRVESLTPDEIKVRTEICVEALKFAQQLFYQKPHVIADLALLLHFMDFHLEATELLKKFDEKRAHSWLLLELLLQARQFATALDECGRIESEYAANPETMFAVTYARARALWGLSRKTEAVDLMTSLVRIRPKYKSAQSLLMEWTGGEAEE